MPYIDGMEFVLYSFVPFLNSVEKIQVTTKLSLFQVVVVGLPLVPEA